MNRLSSIFAICLLTLVMLLTFASSTSQGQIARNAPDGKLAVVWTSADPDVAHRMVFMYTHNAKKAGWFAEVQLIIWGPSQKLFVEDQEVQAKVLAMKKDGVEVRACIACARSYGLVEKIRELGIEVLGMGVPLTELIKSDWKVITF